MRPQGRDSHRNQKEGSPPTSHYLRLHRRLLVVLHHLLVVLHHLLVVLHHLLVVLHHLLGVQYLHPLLVGQCLHHQLGHLLRAVRFRLVVSLLVHSSPCWV